MIDAVNVKTWHGWQCPKCGDTVTTAQGGGPLYCVGDFPVRLPGGRQVKMNLHLPLEYA